MSSEEEDNEEYGEQLDPRIRDKLEELNECTDNINKLEKQLEELNALFRNTLNDLTLRLRGISLKLGKCVEESRPYYESKAKAIHLQSRCQSAALQFERSSQLHSEAKHTITLTELKFHNNCNNNDFDTVWQEMLNQAINKFTEAEALKRKSESEHNKCMQNYLEEEKRVSALEKQLKSAIKKSKPYYEESANVQTELNNIKARIEQLSQIIIDSKKSYSKTLKDLENISEEIHEKRAQMLAKSFKREPGVGAELESDSNKFCEERQITNNKEVPQIKLDSELNNSEAFTSLSPNSIASRSLSCLSNSSNTEDDNHFFAFNSGSDIDIDKNGNSNDNCLEKAFVEIDLNN